MQTNLNNCYKVLKYLCNNRNIVKVLNPKRIARNTCLTESKVKSILALLIDKNMVYKDYDVMPSGYDFVEACEDLI